MIDRATDRWGAARVLVVTWAVLILFNIGVVIAAARAVA